MRILLLAICGALAGCAAQPAGDLPPLEDVDQASLAEERVQPMAPPEEGPAARNPDDPFILATIDADQRVTGIFAGGVSARNPAAPACSAALQGAQAARIAITAPPAPCLEMDFRVQGPGAGGVVFPDPPPEESPDKADESWFDRMISIFG